MKEQYINMRNTIANAGDLLYTYAVSQGFQGNSMAFMIALNYVNPIELVEDLDRKFELTLLTDKNGDFIKVVI